MKIHGAGSGPKANLRSEEETGLFFDFLRLLNNFVFFSFLLVFGIWDS